MRVKTNEMRPKITILTTKRVAKVNKSTTISHFIEQ